MSVPLTAVVVLNTFDENLEHVFVEPCFDDDEHMLCPLCGRSNPEYRFRTIFVAFDHRDPNRMIIAGAECSRGHRFEVHVPEAKLSGGVTQ